MDTRSPCLYMVYSLKRDSDHHINGVPSNSRIISDVFVVGVHRNGSCERQRVHGAQLDGLFGGEANISQTSLSGKIQ